MTVQIPAPLGGTGLHVKVSLSKILNPKVAPDVQMSSVRVLCELATHAGCTLAYAHCVNWIWPLRGKRQHPATLTDKRKDNETKNKTKQNIKKNKKRKLDKDMVRKCLWTVCKDWQKWRRLRSSASETAGTAGLQVSVPCRGKPKDLMPTFNYCMIICMIFIVKDI